MGLFNFLFRMAESMGCNDSSFDGFRSGGEYLGHENFGRSDDFKDSFGPFGDGRSDSNSFITYDDSYFKSNDEDRAICEDMFGDRAINHDVDLEYHYGWENKLNYDTDGYEDEEDWDR